LISVRIYTYLSYDLSLSFMTHSYECWVEQTKKESFSGNNRASPFFCDASPGFLFVVSTSIVDGEEHSFSCSLF